MNLSKNFVIGDTKNLFNSIVKASENCKNSTHGKNVVKVSNNVIGIVKCDIKASIRNNNTGYTPDSKKKNKTKSKQ